MSNGTALTAQLRRGAHGVRASWSRAWPAVAAYVVVRLIGFVALAVRLSPHDLRQHLMTRYDSTYYLDIAQHGYGAVLQHACTTQGPHCQYAFFPLYPTLIKAVHAIVPVQLQYVGLAVALLGSVLAAWGIFAVVDLVAGRRAGVFAAVLWGLLPHAVVETIAYSEPMFTALAAWSMYCALRNRWLSAAGLALLAGLTRPTGLAVVVAVEVGILAAMWAARRAPEARGLGRLLAAMIVAPLGWLGWVLYVGVREHAWNGYLRIERKWHTGFDAGRYTVHTILHIFHSGRLSLDTVEVAATTVLALVLLIVSVEQGQPLVLLAYSAVSVALAVGTSGYFWSKSRFLLGAFALLIPVARALSRTQLRIAVTLLISMTVASSMYGVYLLGALRASP